MADSKIQIVINAIDNASMQFKAVANNLDNAAEKMKKLGKGMNTYITLPILAVGAAAVKSSIDFDDAMTKAVSIMNVTIEQEREMEKVAREVAKTTSASHKEIASSYFYLASAGLDANAAIAAMPVVAEFAQAGAFDLSLATDLLTDAQSALGLTIRDDVIKNMENMIRVSDVLVKANTLANATVEQFSTALTTEAGAALKSFNIDIEEGVAVLAAFADQGIKGQIAGSGLSRILRLMTAGANKNAKEMRALGLNIYDAEGNIRNLGLIIQDLEEAFEGMSDKQRTMALESIGFTARVQGIILPLLGTSEAIKKYEEELRNAEGTTSRVSNTQLESFKNQLLITKNKITDVAIEIGDILMPHIITLIDKIENLVSKFLDLTKEQQKTILKIAALSAAVGPLLIMFSMLITAITTLLSPIGLLIVALGLFSALAYKLIKDWENFKKAIKKIITSVVTFVRKKINELSDALGVVATALGFEKIEKSAEESMGNVQETTEVAAQGMSQAFDFASASGKNAFLDMEASSGEFIDAFGNGYSAVAEKTSRTNEQIAAEFAAAMDSINTDAEEGGQSLAEVGESVADAFKRYSDTVKDYNVSVKNEIEATIGKVADLQEKLLSIEKGYTEKRKDNNATYAQAYLDQEARIKDAREVQNAEEDFAERAKLTEKLNNEIAVLEEFAWMEKTYHTEIDYLRAESLKSELQRQVEKLKSKEWHELAEYQKAKEKVLSEIAIETTKYEALVKLQEQGLIDYATYLADSEAMTAISIDKEIAKYNALADAVARARTAQASYSGYSFSTQNLISGLTGARADGGPVSSGGSYLVGERGPEIFTPRVNGNILANGGGGINVNLNGTYLSENVAEEIGDMIIEKLKNQIRI